MSLFSFHSSMHSFKRLLPTALCLLSLTGAAFLSGCADNTPPETFPAPNYDYLPQMNLNVSTIAVTDQTQTQRTPDSLVAQDPTSPSAALTLMAQQRLHATGNNGIGNFTITDIHIDQPNDRTVSGHFAVKLTLSNGAKKGSITAQVSRESTRQNNVTLRHHLFTLTQQMMDDMNVELEYQIRKNFDIWLTDATGMPLNSTIEAQSLTPSTNLPPITSNNTPLAPTSNTSTTTNSASSTTIHSPTPSTLHLP